MSKSVSTMELYVHWVHRVVLMFPRWALGGLIVGGVVVFLLFYAEHDWLFVGLVAQLNLIRGLYGGVSPVLFKMHVLLLLKHQFNPEGFYQVVVTPWAVQHRPGLTYLSFLLIFVVNATKLRRRPQMLWFFIFHTITLA